MSFLSNIGLGSLFDTVGHILHAQPSGTLGLDTDTVGSAGTLVGAALETAGQYMQSEFLDMMTSGLALSLGGFLYIMAGVFAIFIMAVGGRYKYGLWFLFGPAIFLLLINVRTTSTGTYWHFGARDYDQSRVAESVSGVVSNRFVPAVEGRIPSEYEITNADGERVAVNVSYFFALWNRLTSEIVQNFVSVLNITGNYSDLDFMNKGERYNMLFTQDVTDPKLKIFLDLMMVNECGGYFTLRRDLFDENFEIARWNIVSDKLNSMNVPRASLNEYPDIRNYIEASERLPDILATLGVPDLGTTITCEQIWDIAIILTRDHAQFLIARVYGVGGVDELPIEERRREILKKFSYTTELEDGSMRVVTTDDEVAFNLMLNEVTGRILLKQLGQVNSNIIMRDFDKHPTAWDSNKELHSQDMARAIRAFSAASEYQGKGDFMTSMLALPYIQGLALFILALLFPFFALTVVVPGRQGGILMWMSLWLWIKSWDFGFAVVMLIDDLLYLLLPHGPPIDDATLADSGDAFKELLQVDPSYSVFTYYNLLSISLGAVPILTGVFVQRGAGQVLTALNQGFANFSGRVGSAMGLMQRSMIAGGEANRAQRAILNHANVAAQKVLAENPAIAQKLMEAGATGMLNNIRAGKLGSDFFNGAASLALSGKQRRELNTGLAMLKAGIDMEMYKRSTEYDIKKAAARSVGLGMFSRHFTREYPGESLVNVIAESAHPQIDQKASENLTINGLKGLVGGAAARAGVTSRVGPDGVLVGAAAATGLIEGDQAKRHDATSIKPKLKLEYPEFKKDPNEFGTRARAYRQQQRKSTFFPEVRNVSTNLDANALLRNAGVSGVNPITQSMAQDSMENRSLANEQIEAGEASHSRSWGQASPEVTASVKERVAAYADAREFTAQQKQEFIEKIEQLSGFNPSVASASTTAAGLGGFTVGEWRNFWTNMANEGRYNKDLVNKGVFPSRFNADASLIALAELKLTRPGEFSSRRGGR